MSFNQSGTFFYTPDIKVFISTMNNGMIDVSSDIINFNMDREIASPSSFSCTLNNPGRKYNRTINTMDRITVFLKRTNEVQCFTGLVTYAPIETLVPTPITINAYCTLYLLQNTYWDDTLIQYQQLLLNYMDQTISSSNQTTNDGGIAQAVVNVLTDVCGWNANSIHIQGIPANFISFAANAYSDLLNSNTALENSIYSQLSQILSIDSIASGKSVSSGGTEYKTAETLKNSDAPDNSIGVTITASKAIAFNSRPIGGGLANFPGFNPNNPVDLKGISQDIYYCSAPFSYMGLKDSGEISRAKSWLAYNRIKKSYDGRLLLLANQRTNRVVAVRATSVSQKANLTEKNQAVYDDSVDYLQCHPAVVAYLNGSIKDVSSWKQDSNVSDYANITFQWADQTKISAGVQPNLNTTQADSYFGVNSTGSTDPSSIPTAIATLLSNLRGQLGDQYSKALKGSHYRITPGAAGSGKGWFDCSGLAYWGYSTIGINLYGSNTTKECGSSNGDDPGTYGQWIPNSVPPQPGDLMFWEVPKDGGGVPQHVTICSVELGGTPPKDNVRGSISVPTSPNVGYSIQASEPGIPVNEKPFYWDQIKDGQWQDWGGGWKGRLIGCRRPITLHHGWGTGINQNSNPNVMTSSYYNVTTSAVGATSPNTSNTATTTTTPAANPVNANDRTAFSLTDAYNTPYLSPNFNIAASVVQGTPRAFILDNPVMNDITTIMSAGLRTFQSAPNGDFISWFPDYYGIYGTDPVLEISPVEIVDFQIYHDDTQLITHVAVLGDTTGIGQQVSFADQITTQGIVSIQDVSTMEILFGKYSSNLAGQVTNAKNVLNFLNRYGIRPFVQEQSVIHSHTLEYIYALQSFMQQWVNQFVSNVSFTFMPELYPGMRVALNLDNESGGTDHYEFYVTSVQHQGDRTGGFSTQATLTAPIKNGTIMHYGIDLVQ